MGRLSPIAGGRCGNMNVRDLTKITDFVWEIPRTGGMRVPARLYASERMLPQIFGDNAPQQAVNVAHLPGIVAASLAMPDIHWGYGFPIGGVAAFDVEEGIVSPGGVGYDINCGVRLMAAGLSRTDIAPHLELLLNELFRRVPSGVGSSGALSVSTAELRQIAVEGARWAVRSGYGTAEDLERMEENGCIADAAPDHVSERAWARGLDQVGTLGSGNHFLEVGYVSEVYNQTVAQAMGLALEQVTVIVHSGSRGFGHQICDDYLAIMDRATRKYSLHLPDRQLACAPLRSSEGQSYLGAMRCAVNYAFANRQVIAEAVRRSFAKVFGSAGGSAVLHTVYEVAHNIAKIETHQVGDRTLTLCVHRKGATRAFAAGHADLPDAYRAIGQPVLIPGDMGRCSYVLIGTEKAMEETFGSACHGAGRLMSRQKALQASRNRQIARELADRGILVRAQNRRTLDEEIPEAYKDVSLVVDTCVQAGIARRVVQIKPLGCLKG